MTKEDLKQIAELLDEKLEKSLKDNNKSLRLEFKELLQANNAILKEEITSEIGELVNTAFSEFEGKVYTKFDEIDQKFAEINNRLETMPTTSHLLSWGDNTIVPIRVDNMKLKFLHMKEFKDLPDNLTMQSALSEEGLD